MSDKDIKKLRQFYDDCLIYFDNHKGNDTYSINSCNTIEMFYNLRIIFSS